MIVEEKNADIVLVLSFIVLVSRKCGWYILNIKIKNN